MFSTLPSVMMENVVFQDPYARDLSVRCGIIPRKSGDLFRVLYFGPGDSSLFPIEIAINFVIQITFTPYPGDVQWYNRTTLRIAMSTGAFAIGGNKESINSPPVFWFDDILLSLWKSHDTSAAGFAYISTQYDSLKLDPSVGFAPPVQCTLQVQTWSFINNDTQR